MYEGFGLLPEMITVPIPGFLRLSDLFFVSLPILYLFGFKKIFTIFRTHTQASIFITVGCFLVIIGLVMAQVHFGQSLITGLLKLRQFLNLFLFFVLLILISNEKETVSFIRGLFLIVIVIGVLSLIQYFNPNIPIFRGEDLEVIYSGEKYLRNDSYRILFPAAALSVLIYFYVLGELIAVKKPEKFYWKVSLLIFLFLLFYLQQTRARLLTITVVTIYALLTSRNKKYIICAFTLTFLFTCAQFFLYAVSNKTQLENSTLFKLTESVLNISDTKEASINDRLSQVEMYWRYFKKYPVLGAGTLEIESPLSLKFGLYNTSDLGYVKMLGEYGIMGVFWFVWLLVYIFKRTRNFISENTNLKNPNLFNGIIKGTRLFYWYITVTMLTLPHFGRGRAIIYMTISLVLLELTIKLSKDNSSIVQEQSF
jgi:hypothetical protein